MTRADGQGAAVRRPVAAGLLRRRRQAPDHEHRPADHELPQLLLRRPAPGQEPVHAPAAEGRRDRGRRHDPRPDRRRHADQRLAPGVHDPAGRQERAADRPQADPRRLEAARGHRGLPRRRRRPVLRPRRQEPDDRPDPADVQGAAPDPGARRTRTSQIYACGRRDIQAGADRPPRSSPRSSSCPPRAWTRRLRPEVRPHAAPAPTGIDAAGATGASVDIPEINGIPILGHQGPGSITDITIRRLLTLQGAMQPDQIISDDRATRASPTRVALPDHDEPHPDHLHPAVRRQQEALQRRSGASSSPASGSS